MTDKSLTETRDVHAEIALLENVFVEMENLKLENNVILEMLPILAASIANLVETHAMIQTLVPQEILAMEMELAEEITNVLLLETVEISLVIL